MTDAAKDKIKFIKEYVESGDNAATGSKYDSNANVTVKNVATLQNESGKRDLIDLHRGIVEYFLEKRYGHETVEDYYHDVGTHIIYPNDESSIFPYCCAISLYPFLLNGTKGLGGNATAPKSTNSFVGGLINLIYLISGQTAGAVAVPEALTYMDHFLRQDFGDDYPDHLDEMVITYGNRKRNLEQMIKDWFEQIVYSINEPASARGYQSVFLNFGYFDKYYFESIFDGFVFPDGDIPCWETTKELQKIFMKFFNKERLRADLTFPVESANILNQNGKFTDEEMADFFAEMWAEGHSFFMYQSDSVDALSSCCFSGDTEVICKSQSNRIIFDTFENIYDVYKNNSIEVYNNGKWNDANIIRLPKRKMYRVNIDNTEDILVSDNHLHVTYDNKLVETKDLKPGDRLKFDKLIAKKEFGTITSISVEKYDDDYIYCFEMVDHDNPYFTLANGLVTHNCRLRNAVEKEAFSYTLGAGGVETGSKCVITMNLNRITQNWDREGRVVTLSEYIRAITKRVHKYLNAWNDWLWYLKDHKILTVYEAGFVQLDKLYLTVGVNGFIEAAEYLGIKPSPYNEEYKQLARDILGTIKQVNQEDKTEHCKWNTEFVPAENAAAKLYNWDKEDGYWVPDYRNLYTSYFYPVEDPTVSPIDKFYYQGDGFATECDGGVANHVNLSEHLSKAQYRKLMDIAVKAGCNYFTFNIPNTVCNDCGFRSKHTLKECPKCGSKNLDYLTRIIGYLKRISNFPKPRRIEASHRYYAKPSDIKFGDDK